ncbi:MAG TPA: hypothetical protein DCL73_10675 [Treponema sp.]|nr:hypothetical protein [Treponema sp.]
MHGNLETPASGTRTAEAKGLEGCRDYLLGKYPEIISAGMFETEENLSTSAKITQKCLDEIKDLDLIYVTD